MRFVLILLTGFYAFVSPAMFCDEPFSEHLYEEARNTFLNVYHARRDIFDDPGVLALHGLISKGFDESEADRLVDPGDRTRLIRKRVGVYRLAAVHVAAMVGDINALKWLFENGADLNAQDKRGFGAVHFAALNRTRDCLEFLISAGASPYIVNEFGANCDQMWSLTHLTPFAQQHVYFYDQFTGRVDVFDGDFFCLFTGAYFAHAIKQTPKGVIDTWNEEFKALELDAAKNFIDNLLAQSGSRIGALYLKSTEPLSFNRMVTAEDYRLYANRDFETGEIVDLYAGLWEPRSNAVVHDLAGVKTDLMRGYLSFASLNGLPNVVMVQFFNRMGVSQGFFGISIRPIKKGEEIVRERLKSEPKPNNVIERHAEALNAILETTTLSEISESKEKKGFDIIDIRNRAIAQYLLDNKPVFNRLLAEQRVTMNEFKQFAFAYNIPFLEVLLK